MEIIVRLAGVELGPYTEVQARQHMAEGLLSANDPAKCPGMADWVALSDVLAKSPLAPALPPPATETDEIPELPKRPSAPPPGMRPISEKDPEVPSAPETPVGVQDKKTMLLGPTSPKSQSPTPPGAFSTATTSPLVSQNQATKKVARGGLAKALSQNTAPLARNITSLPPRSPAAPPLSKSPAPSEPAEPAETPKPEQRKAPPLPGEERTAKTVPMRSAAPPLPQPRSTIPVTAPMPTRQVFKPKTGAVAPPTVAGSMVKKPGPPSLEKSPTAPPLDDIAAEVLAIEVPTTKLPPPAATLQMDLEETGAPSKLRKVVGVPALPKPPAAPEVPAEPTPASASEAPAKTKSPAKGKTPVSKITILLAACGAVALLVIYYVWSPYHAAASLTSALNNGDAAGLESTIDFPAVRDSLKQQIHSQLAASGAQPANATAMIDQSIDLYVTPDGLSQLVKTPDVFPKSVPGVIISPSVAANILLGFNTQPVTKQGLTSLIDFAVDRDVAIFHLQFEGFGWKLKRIELQPSLQLQAPSDKNVPLLSPVVDTYLEAGNERLKKSEWDEAIADFTQVLAVDPQSSIAYEARASARQEKGDLDGAIKDYTQAVTIDPGLASAFSGRGNVEATKNDVDGAITDFNQAIRLDPALATAYDSRGNAKTAKDDLDGAIADYTKAILIDPNLASAYSDRGFARQANGNLDGAITDYTQALALKPKTAMAYYNRGLARQSQGNYEAAIVDFDRTLAFDPKMAGAYFSRGNAKSSDHDLDGAIADYTQGLALNPKFASGYSSRGQARQAKGDLDGALGDYTLALSLDPKLASAYLNRGLIEGQRNDLDGAIADSTQAIYLDSRNAQAYSTRGYAKLAKGNLDGALADLKQFCDLAPRDHASDHARLYLWLIAKAQNAMPDPDQELSDALENSWNSPPVDIVSKTAAFLLGRMNEADYLAAASSTDTKIDQAQHCETWYFAGMKRLLMGDKKGATDAFHQAVATGLKDSTEYILAQSELQGLEAPALPSAVPATAPAKKL